MRGVVQLRRVLGDNCRFARTAVSPKLDALHRLLFSFMSNANLAFFATRLVQGEGQQGEVKI